jgi:hypothetical protein
MTVAGWILLLASLTFVFGLAGWCYWKVLSTPESKE